MTATRTVKVFGQELRVEVRPGSGAGTPLLMCCGVGISYEGFDLMVEALDPGIEIVRVDVPGVGGSPVRIWAYGFPELAWLLAVLLDELGYQRVDVLGFSWGGALAQQFAVQYRGRCRRLVLISTSPGLLSIPGRPRVLVKMLTPKRFRGTDHAAGLLYAGDIGGHGDEVRRLFRDSQVGGSGLGYLYQLAAAAGWSSLPFLGLIRQPVLVMGGDADPIVPVANARILADLIPDATLHVFAGLDGQLAGAGDQPRRAGITGLAELSVVNRAIGVLITRGHTPAEAHAELRRRAADTPHSVPEVAEHVLASTNAPPAHRSLTSTASGSAAGR